MTTATKGKLSTKASTKSPEFDLKKENSELRKLLEEAISKLSELSESPKLEEEDDGDIDIRPDRYIRVISLCPHPLNLSTRKKGGKNFRFANLGQEKRILYQDLLDIIETNSSFAEQGLFYILNKDVIRRHGLSDFYDSILKKDEMLNIITSDTDVALRVFKTANRRQQEHIGEILENMLIRGESVDMNLVYHIGKEIGRDIDEIATNARNYNELKN